MTEGSPIFDIVVVGAGPAGLAAATVAAEVGQKVALLDSSFGLGGQIWRGVRDAGHSAPLSASGVEGQGEKRPLLPKNPTARYWLQRFRASGAEFFPGATVFASLGPVLAAEMPQGVRQFPWRKLILATGAREVFLPFPGWTLPGVVGPGGFHAMVKDGWPIAGKRVVVAGTGPLLLAVAEALQAHGAIVLGIAEQTAFANLARFGASLVKYPGKLWQAIATKTRLFGVPYWSGCWPVKVDGEKQVQSVTLSDGRRAWTEHCDFLACGFHLAPNLELPLLLGCAVANGFVRVNELQETSIPAIYCAGEPTGIGGAESALVEGQIAGFAAANRLEQASRLRHERNAWINFKRLLASAFELRPELRRLADDQTILCRCEDIRCGDVARFDGWRAAKLQTRCGMGSCQGRICGTAARFLFGWEPSSVRPPIFPVRISSMLLVHDSVSAGSAGADTLISNSSHHP